MTISCVRLAHIYCINQFETANPNLTQNPNQCPESYPNHNQIPNPKSNLTEELSLFSLSAKHWSRDHIESSFSLITPQDLDCIFTIRHVGWFGFSVKKYVGINHQICEILRFKDPDFWKFLGEWISISICGRKDNAVRDTTCDWA